MKTHFARKRFGQNFLSNTAIIDQLIRCLNLKSEDTVLEIGPGMGAITTHLIAAVDHLTAIEIDRDLLARLQDKFTPDQITLIEADALKYDFHALPAPVRLVGNLPYNISTPLLFHFLKAKQQFIDMHFMLQKEVVDRMVATPNQKAYGRLSVMIQYHCQATALFNIPGHAFTPPPKVKSAFVHLKPYPQSEHPFGEVNAALFETVVRTCFTLRRKTIHNSLKPWLSDADFANLDLSMQLRPENLSVQDFVNITRYIDRQG